MAHPEPPDLPVPDRLLDAALAVAADHGLARLSVGDVARRAGLSRQTLYKHFSSRDELVARAVLREAGRLTEAVIARSEAHHDPAAPVASLEAAILEALALVRDHPLLDRLIQTEPEALLPLLVDERGSVQGAVLDVVAQVIDRRVPGLDPERIRLGADLLSRMLVSYAVRPPDQPAPAVARFLAVAVVGALVDPTPLDPSSTRATRRPA